MTWYPDLSQQTIMASGAHVRAIGWLHPDHPFSKGPVSPEFVTKLTQFIGLSSESSSTLFCIIMMGPHTCEFCGQNKDNRNFGVPCGELLYVAPAMIGHYIEQHEYQPPEEFIAALAASPLPSSPQYNEACSKFEALHRIQISKLLAQQRG